MMLESQAAIEIQCRIISGGNFQMNDIDAAFARGLHDQRHGPRGDAAIAKLGQQVQFIDIRLMTAIFKTETDGKNDVARKLAGFLDEPYAAISGIGDELLENETAARFVERREAGIAFLQGAHHPQEDVRIVQGDAAKLNFRGVTHRSVPKVWRRGRSSRSGDWRR